MAVKQLSKSFYELTNHRLNNASQLLLFNMLEDEDSNRFVNIFRTYTLNDDILNDTMYYFTHKASDEWWDTIATKYYENPNLWWLICLMNSITNPFEDLEPGQEVKIMKENHIYQLIKEMKNISEL
jgi:hypothetical protein